GRAFSVAFVEPPHGRVFGEVHDDPLFDVDTSITRNNTGGSAFGLRLPQLPGGSVEQGDPLLPQQFGGPALGLFPGRDRLLDQALSLGGEAEWLGTGVLVRHDLQPAVGLQRLDVAAEGGGVQLQNLTDLGGPGQAEFGGHDEDVQLADLQAQRAQGIVVEVGDDPVEQPQAHGDALPGDRVNAAGRAVV